MSQQPLETLLAHRATFLGFVASRVESRAIAEDILQDGFARALERVDDLRSAEAVIPWFYQLLRNAVIDHHRKHGVSARALERLAAEMPQEHQPQEPPRTVCPCVARLARELKAEYAEALQRVEVDCLAVKQLAEEAGITSGNAAVRVFRARDLLRKKVKTTCGTCASAGCTDCSCSQIG